MSPFDDIRLAVRLMWRDARAGELTLLAAALVIAVACVTTVGFFSDRMHAALAQQANQLLGADLVIAGDRPLPEAYAEEALRRGLAIAHVARFPSMALHAEASVLADIKVVSPGYPLRGEMRVADALYGPDRRASGIPVPGTIWADERLCSQLSIARGGIIELGRSRFTVALIVTQDPDVAIGFLNAGPRIIMNESDIRATGLIQPGSRVRYRIELAGAPEAVESYRGWAEPRLQPGQRIQGIRDARPEIRSALERAEKFLALAALVSVVIAAAGTALAARRFVQRHLDAYAMMRCVGATGRRIIMLYATQLFLLGALAAAVGCAAGFLGQALLAYWLAGLVNVSLPAPGMMPLLHGFITGLTLLLGFALPPVIALAKVPTLRVLRRELGLPQRAGAIGYVIGLSAIALLVFWRAGEVYLGVLAVGWYAGAIVAAGVIAWVLIRLLSAARFTTVSWRYGIANLQRRPLGTVVQTIALGIGMMALLTLTLIRGDLLAAWQNSLPPDMPNRFVVNVQPDQLHGFSEFFAARHIAAPKLYPMVRGRLVKVNGRPVSATNYDDERARRLIDREFNLSWARGMQPDNRIVAGRWWVTGQELARKDQLSLEEGIARALGLKVGDALTFDVAGNAVGATITSLRKVDWDTFNVNFFAIVPPGLLDGYPVSYVTSFYLPPGHLEVLTALVQRFPNVLLIDVAQILAQVQRMIEQVARAVEFIFLFTIAAGLIVLYAAIASSHDERLYQASIMRALGATRAQLLRASIAEFALLGVLAGILAAAGASGLGYYVATHVLHLPYLVHGGVWIAAVFGGAAGVALAGYLGTRRVLHTSPLQSMRELS